MDSNLAIKTNPGFKNILLKKLSYAVVSSVTAQVILLFLYLFIVNFDVFHPLNWISSFFDTVTSVYTWLYIIPFPIIIFAQTIICAKDYVLTSKYSSTRFWKFVSIFSLHNFILLILHIVSGGLVVWLYLALTGGKYVVTTKECARGATCLVEGKIFLILCGLWSGLYYFLNMYTSDKKILFPVVYQYKLLQFKSMFFPIIKKSYKNAIWPNVYFITFYYIFGSALRTYVTKHFTLHFETEHGFELYLYAWFFTGLYFMKMHLMGLFFELFLTEPVFFPIESVHKDDLILADAIGVCSIPVIQHLACYDLYMLSCWCPNRRKQLFSLSQPGGHPHNWNNLIQNVLKIINDYTQEINKSTMSILDPEKAKASAKPSVMETLPPHITSPNKIRNIRNMAYREPEPLDIINISQGEMAMSVASVKASVLQKLSDVTNHYLNMLKSKLGINFLFGELPEANIQYCLGNGQIIIWTTQGISSLVTHALEEDVYGIAQKDLPVIISSLVELKLSLEKLNRLPSLSRKGSDDFNVKMKISTNAAVKRSIFNICKDYGQYFRDLNLKRDVAQYLQSIVNSRNCG